MKIEEKNAMIADFASELYTKRTVGEVTYWIDQKNGQPYYDHELKFHEDWNWLMPVVEKIESNINVHNFHILRDTAEIIFTSRSMDYPYIDVGAKTKILAVHRAIVKYLEWFNKSK